MDFNPRFPRGKRLRSLQRGRGVYRISIHASRGGSDFPVIICLPRQSISIHASRGGSDRARAVGGAGNKRFQSTLPAREATGFGLIVEVNGVISIHASREGSDSICRASSTNHSNFNPRFPRGKRPSFIHVPTMSSLFQSTLPAGEATLH